MTNGSSPDSSAIHHVVNNYAATSGDRPEHCFIAHYHADRAFFQRELWPRGGLEINSNADGAK